MISITLQAQAVGNGLTPFVMLFLLIVLVSIGVWLYRKKSQGYASGMLGWLSAFFFVAIAGRAIAKSTSLHAPAFPIVVIEGLFIFVIAICFIIAIYSYKSIVVKQHKTDDDIKKRQKLIRGISYLLAISLTSVPFLLDSWGVNIFPSLEPAYYTTQEEVCLRFINAGVKAALVITIAVFFADNILNRIASEIYVYDDIKDLDNFCLYLRSFNTDKNMEEKLICKMTRNLYPVYAIGDPNKVLQPNGAERIYVTDEIWQDAVKDLSQRCSLILLRIGQTDGTMWEINHIIDYNLIKKVIFIAYHHDDYDYFATKVKETIGIEIPSMDFTTKNPNAFYFIEDNDTMIIKHYRIGRDKDVELMLNEYLKTSPELDNKYSLNLDLRKHNLKYMFDSSRIPEVVRKSLNWGIISPIINMRHWPITVWGIFVLSLVLSGITRSYVPAYTFAFVMLLLGNRIEWAAGGWSSASLFLRHQRREAKILWLSFALGFLYSLLYLALHLALN